MEEGYDVLSLFFSNTMVSISLDSPRLLIFSTSKATRVRLTSQAAGGGPRGDPIIRVDVLSPHFEHHWETLLSKMEESSLAWNIKPQKPCNLEPFNLQIKVTVNGESKNIIDRWANIVCKSSEFPKGLAQLLIQERNGKNVNKEVLHKLKKRKASPNLRLELPHEWGPDEQRSVVNKIWHSLDPKNASRVLCKANQRPPVLTPHHSRIDRSNPLAQYREAWGWVYAVLRFYNTHYATMRDHLGNLPQMIDEDTAQDCLKSISFPAVMVHFSKDGENLVCSLREDGGAIVHRNFATKNKTSFHPIAELPSYLTGLLERNYQYVSCYPPNPDLSLHDVIQLFAHCFNQTNTPPTTAAKPSHSLVNHCNLLQRYLNERRQGPFDGYLAQLEHSLNTVMEEYGINLPHPGGGYNGRLPVQQVVSPRHQQVPQHQQVMKQEQSSPQYNYGGPYSVGGPMNVHHQMQIDSHQFQQPFAPPMHSPPPMQNQAPMQQYDYPTPFQRVPSQIERQRSMDDLSHYVPQRQAINTSNSNNQRPEMTRSGSFQAFGTPPSMSAHDFPLNASVPEQNYAYDMQTARSHSAGLQRDDIPYAPVKSEQPRRGSYIPSPNYFEFEDGVNGGFHSDSPQSFAFSSPDYGFPGSHPSEYSFSGLIESLSNCNPPQEPEKIAPMVKKRKLRHSNYSKDY